MKCPNCGATIDKNDECCYTCGGKITIVKNDANIIYFMAAMFALAVIYNAYLLYRINQFSNYPEEVGIFESYEEITKQDEPTEYECKYIYFVNDKMYEAKKVVYEKPVNNVNSELSLITIKYNPDDPADYMVEDEKESGYIIATMVVCTGLVIFLLYLKRDQVKVETAQEQVNIF